MENTEIPHSEYSFFYTSLAPYCECNSDQPYTPKCGSPMVPWSSWLHKADTYRGVLRMDQVDFRKTLE
jgi:hypothetical protein